MKTNPDLHVLIVGHTDNKGKVPYNQALSQQRAKAVVDMLVKAYGIPAARMTAVGVGPAAPPPATTATRGRRRTAASSE